MAFPPPPQKRPDATAPTITAPVVSLPPAPPVTVATAQPASATTPATFAFGAPKVDEAALAAEVTAKNEAMAASILAQAAVVQPVAPAAPIAFAPRPAPTAVVAPVVAKVKRPKKAFGASNLPIPAVGGLDAGAVLTAFVEFFKQPGCPSLESVGDAVKKITQAEFPDTAAGRKAFRASAIILAVAQWASTKSGFQKRGDAKSPLAKYRASMLDLIAMVGLDAVAAKWGAEKLQSVKLTAAELLSYNITCTPEQAQKYGIVV